MFKLEGYSVIFETGLRNGVYRFVCESAIGKTRLYYLLKDYYTAGEPVVAYSYTDYQMGLDLETLVNKVKPVVIIVDRYDMFYGKYSDLLLEWGKSSVVLVDTKNILSFTEYDDACGIKMTPERVVVY